MFPITSLYAGLLTLLFIVLSARVIRYRRGNKINLGTGGDQLLETRMRGHGNFAENAPLGILLLALIEAQGAPTLALHVLGLLLLSGRVAHAIGFSGTRPWMRLRVIGMVLTFTMLGVSAFGLVVHSLI